MAPGSQATRLLLADDDPKLRQFLELELGEEGYAVQSVASGMEALLAIRQAKPELVILDWMLPDRWTALDGPTDGCDQDAHTWLSWASPWWN